MERITISLDKGLAKQFDTFIKEFGYSNRSEAMRDLIRERLEQERLQNWDEGILRRRPELCIQPSRTGTGAACDLHSSRSSRPDAVQRAYSPGSRQLPGSGIGARADGPGAQLRQHGILRARCAPWAPAPDSGGDEGRASYAISAAPRAQQSDYLDTNAAGVGGR